MQKNSCGPDFIKPVLDEDAIEHVLKKLFIKVKQKFYSNNTEELEQEFQDLNLNYQPTGRGSHIPELCEACHNGTCNPRATDDRKDRNRIGFNQSRGRYVDFGQRDNFVKWDLFDSSLDSSSDFYNSNDGNDYDDYRGSKQASIRQVNSNYTQQTNRTNVWEQRQVEFQNLNLNHQPAIQGSQIPELCEACVNGTCNPRTTDDRRKINRAEVQRSVGRSMDCSQQGIIQLFIISLLW